MCNEICLLCFFVVFASFYTFYDRKVVLASKIDFDQRTICGAPVHWLKCTTDISKRLNTNSNWLERLVLPQSKFKKVGMSLYGKLTAFNNNFYKQLEFKCYIWIHVQSSFVFQSDILNTPLFSSLFSFGSLVRFG